MIIISHKAKQSKRKKKKYWQKFKPWFQDFQRLFLLKKCQTTEGRTVFVIAHRLSTVRNAKAIMVMDHGRIIERGEHDYLIGLKGMYYQLYTGAFELE